MIYDLQKAGVLKRASAYIFDMILLLVLATGLAFVLSALLGYDRYSEQLDACYAKYEEQYGITFEITQEEYDALTPAQKQNYDDATAALNRDETAVRAFNMMFSLMLVILTLSILAGYAILEILVPLLFGNGQTLGKKIFGIALMRTNGVKINTVCLFIRTVLGKFTIETMIPVLLCVMIFFSFIGILGPTIIFILLVAQAAVLIVTKTNSAIHDLLADTVVVDLSSQLMFNSELERLDYQKKVAAERAAKKPY
ncbi:MAG: RDD family protein [Faecousia sp.]